MSPYSNIPPELEATQNRERNPKTYMATNYTITGPAYIKLFFHLAKHPHQRVNGVFIGKETPDGGVEATDTIPLLHHWTSLSPMMEIGLDLVDTFLST